MSASTSARRRAASACPSTASPSRLTLTRNPSARRLARCRPRAGSVASASRSPTSARRRRRASGMTAPGRDEERRAPQRRRVRSAGERKRGRPAATSRRSWRAATPGDSGRSTRSQKAMAKASEPGSAVSSWSCLARARSAGVSVSDSSQRRARSAAGPTRELARSSAVGCAPLVCLECARRCGPPPLVSYPGFIGHICSLMRGVATPIPDGAGGNADPMRLRPGTVRNTGDAVFPWGWCWLRSWPTSSGGRTGRGWGGALRARLLGRDGSRPTPWRARWPGCGGQRLRSWPERSSCSCSVEASCSVPGERP